MKNRAKGRKTTKTTTGSGYPTRLIKNIFKHPNNIVGDVVHNKHVGIALIITIKKKKKILPT